MNLSKLLYELQLLDSEIEKRQESLRKIDARLGDSEALKTSQSNFDSATSHLAALEVKQRELETQIDDLQSKIGPLKEKLYGGTIRNPKELVSLEQENEMLRKQLKGIEDSLLDLMNEVETARGNVRLTEQGLNEVQSAWKQEHKSLLEQQAKAREELHDFGGRRSILADSIEPDSLAAYSQLKRGKGRAVARVEQGRCQGCYISLTVSDWQKVRSTAIVHCSNCGRIMHLE